MLKHIYNALLISEIEKKIESVKNVLAGLIVGFNTKEPKVSVIFNPELEREDRESILNTINTIMYEYGIHNVVETIENKVGFDIVYSR